MMILATKWSTAWLMTGLGFSAVFLILVLLVLILMIFSKVASSAEVKPKAAAKPTVRRASDGKQVVEGYEEDMVAVATAVYLYLNSAHDEESGVLTIQNDEHSLWHAELNASV